MNAARPQAVEPSSFSAIGWPELLPLRRDLTEPEPFPCDALPPDVRGVYDLMRLTIQAPDALCGQSLLAATALAAQAHADVEIDGRIVALNQFFVGVGISGERKSACDRVALAPHRKWEEAAQRSAEKARHAYELEDLKWKRQRDQQVSSKQESLSDEKQPALGEPPQPPLMPFLRAEEPTYEGLIKLLSDCWPSVGLFSDEGGRFLGGAAMSQQNKLKTSAGLSSLWDDGAATRVRASEAPQSLRGRRVSMHMLVQPLASDLIFGDTLLADQGLLSRILAIMPTSTIGYRPYARLRIDNTPEAAIYEQTIMRLLEMPLSLRDGSRLELAPRPITLAPDTYELWVRFHDNVEPMMRSGGHFEAIRGFAAKAPEHVLRIAGTRAVVCDPETSVLTYEHLEAAIRVVNFYLNEALRLFGGISVNPRLALAERCYQFIRSRPKSIISLRDLMQFGPNGVRQKDIAEDVLSLLEIHGWVRRLPGSHTINGRVTKCAWESRRDVDVSTIPAAGSN